MSSSCSLDLREGSPEDASSRAWRLQFMDPGASLQLATEALHQAQERQDEWGAAHAEVAMAVTLIRRKNPPDILSRLDKIQDVFRKHEDHLGMLRAQFAKGLSQIRTGGAVEIARNQAAILEEAERHGEPFDVVAIRNLIANAAKRLNDVDSSLRHYISALDLARRNGLTELEGALLMNIGDTQYLCGNNESALEYLSQALALLRQHGIRSLECAVVLNLMSTYLAMDQPDRALEVMEDLLATPLEELRQRLFGATLAGVFARGAQIHAILQNWQKVDEYIELAKTEAAGVVNLQYQIGICRARGLIGLGRGDLQEALAAFLEGDQLLAKNEQPTYQFTKEIHHGLARTYAALGQWDKAYAYSLKHLEACNVLHDAATRARLLTTRVHEDLARAERERDLARLRQIQAERQHAFTDSLTKLPNIERISLDGEELLLHGHDLVVVMLGIVRFRAINEALGHDFGDRVLIEAANRLASIPGLTVCRHHSYKFCILTSDLEGFETLRGLIDACFAGPFNLDGQDVDIVFSAGIARSPEHGTTMPQLMLKANVALRATRHSHDAWVVYSDALMKVKPTDLVMFSALRKAAERAELRMFLQPKVRLGDGAIFSAEALIRWAHPERGIITAGDFIPFAESTGAIRGLTSWILREAMEFASRWAATPRLQVSVNLSNRILAMPGILDELRFLLNQTGADPSTIRLEITESVAMGDPEATLATLVEIRNLGLSLSIDDFGTGYSALAYLQKLPLSELKIDRAFVTGLRAGGDGVRLLDSIIAMGHRLGLGIVAEGAETNEELKLLEALGCDFIQGYVIARPMPSEDFGAWHARYHPFPLSRKKSWI